ncbi:MAG: hypothetical protein HYZ15_15970 [Sphingobacteriales bacterium]|nr:hypothetical protein [Sphingobacteriales bacterium]
MRIISCSVLVTVLFLAACKQPAKKSSPGGLDELAKEVRKNSPGANAGSGHFSIVPAEGWTKLDTSIMGLNCTFISSRLDSEKDHFRENLNVVTEHCGSMGLDEYYAAAVSNMETLSGFKLGKVSDKSIGGTEFKNVKYSHVYSGIPVEVDLYITVKEGIAYLITCSALSGEMEKWGPRFEAMVTSFSVR